MAALFDDMADVSGAAQHAVFGDTVAYTVAATDEEYSISGIFDAAHTLVENTGEVPVETVKPVLSLQQSEIAAAEMPQPKRGDTVVIGATQYRVVEVMPDGRAEVRLVLQKVGDA